MNFLRLLFNKYVITIVLFVLWMLFFDVKDWGLIKDRKDKLAELEQSEAQLNKAIFNAKEELKLLKTNANTIEKYAREKYYMKKDNEDLFIVKQPEAPAHN